jgi:hypothetical protein
VILFRNLLQPQTFSNRICQHLFSFFAICRNPRLDPNPRSPCSELKSPMAAQNQAAQVNSPPVSFNRHLSFQFYLRFLFRFPSGAFY